MSSDAAVQQLVQQAVQAEFDGRFEEAVSLLRRAVLSVMTFCSFMREFSPLRAYALLPPTTRQVAGCLLRDFFALAPFGTS
jgi:hypothetical protein